MGESSCWAAIPTRDVFDDTRLSVISHADGLRRHCPCIGSCLICSFDQHSLATNFSEKAEFDIVGAGAHTRLRFSRATYVAFFGFTPSAWKLARLPLVQGL